jgi:hypothetical protein
MHRANRLPLLTRLRATRFTSLLPLLHEPPLKPLANPPIAERSSPWKIAENLVGFSRRFELSDRIPGISKPRSSRESKKLVTISSPGGGAV